jgi:malonate transporter
MVISLGLRRGLGIIPDMIDILTITAPIYLVIATGFVATRSGVFTKSEAQVLGRFVLHFALPAMLFSALAARDFAEVMNPRYLWAYGLGSLTAFAVSWWVSGWLAPQDNTLRALMGMGSSCSNSGYIGFPILLQLLGPSAGVGLALTLLVENLLMIPMCLSLAESGQSQHNSWRRNVLESFQRMAKAPMMWAIVLGFCFSMLGWHLPEVVSKAVGFFSVACAGTALFVNGCSLMGLRVKGLLPQVSGVVVAKLLVHPAAVAFFMWQIGPAEPRLQISGVVLAAMPMLSIYPLFAQRFGREGLCAAALLATTLVSFLTISGVLAISLWVPGWADVMVVAR